MITSHAAPNTLEPAPTWHQQAACRDTTDPDRFFEAHEAYLAKLTCYRCPVMSQCLAYALEHDERVGVWGGLNEAERRRLAAGKAPRREPSAPDPNAPCGSSDAYRVHVLRGETVDPACYAARTPADRDWAYGHHRRIAKARR